jgi:hypothetical protein
MRSRLILVGVMSLMLSGCAFYRPSAGNPNGDAYLGSGGSTYEARVNPPNTVGQVSYNPSAPLPQPAAATGAGMSASPASP